MKKSIDSLWQLDNNDTPYSPICEGDASAAAAYLDDLESGRAARRSSRRLFEDGEKNRKKTIEKEDAKYKSEEPPKKIISRKVADKMLSRLYKAPEKSFIPEDVIDSDIPQVSSVRHKLSYEESQKLYHRLHDGALDRRKELSTKLYSDKEKRDMDEVRTEYLKKPDDHISNTLADWSTKGAKAISIKQADLVKERMQNAPPSADTHYREEIYKQLCLVGEDKVPFVPEEMLRGNPTSGDRPFTTQCTKAIWKRDTAEDISLVKPSSPKERNSLKVADEHFHEWSTTGGQKLASKTSTRLASSRRLSTPRGTPSQVRKEIHSNLLLPASAAATPARQQTGGPKQIWKHCHGKKDIAKWQSQSFASLVVPYEE